MGLGAPHPDDATLAVHERIDQRGVPIDLDYARALLEAESRVCHAALARAAVALGWVDGDEPDVDKAREHVQSPAKLAKLLAAHGVKVPDCRGDTLERIRTDDPAACAAIEARLAVANVVRGKLEALLAQTCPDGRLRGTLAYYGAQATGRWAGRGPQLQNFTREVDWRKASPLGRRPEPHEMTTITEVQGALRGVVSV
jgi:DNA polymerase